MGIILPGGNHLLVHLTWGWGGVLLLPGILPCYFVLAFKAPLRAGGFDLLLEPSWTPQEAVSHFHLGRVETGTCDFNSDCCSEHAECTRQMQRWVP